MPPNPPMKSAMRPLQEVTRFQIRTSTPSQTTDTLYANGYMQVPVDVGIQVTNTFDNVTIRLSQEELSQIKLVRYDGFEFIDDSQAPLDPLTTGGVERVWWYSTLENGFAHALEAKVLGGHNVVGGASEAYSRPWRMDDYRSTQWVRFWVKTLQVENIRLGATIKLGLRNIEATTFDQDYASSVILTSIPRKRYLAKELVLEERVTGDPSDYRGTLTADRVHVLGKWAQKDYYLYYQSGPVDFVGTHQKYIDKIWSREREPRSSFLPDSCFAYFDSPRQGNATRDITVFKAWKYRQNPETQVNLQYRVTGQTVGNGPTANRGKNFEVKFKNPERPPHSLCISMMRLELNFDPRLFDFDYNRVVKECQLQMFDIYGNCGYFYVHPTNGVSLTTSDIHVIDPQMQAARCGGSVPKPVVLAGDRKIEAYQG